MRQEPFGLFWRPCEPPGDVAPEAPAPATKADDVKADEVPTGETDDAGPANDDAGVNAKLDNGDGEAV